MRFLAGAGIVGGDTPDTLQPHSGFVKRTRPQHLSVKLDQAFVVNIVIVIEKVAVAVEKSKHITRLTDGRARNRHRRNGRTGDCGYPVAVG